MAVEELQDGSGEAIEYFYVQFISSTGSFFHRTRRVRSGWYVRPAVLDTARLRYLLSPLGLNTSITGWNTTLLPATTPFVTDVSDPWSACPASPCPMWGLQCEATAVWEQGCGLRAEEREPPGADSVLSHSFCLAQHRVLGRWLTQLSSELSLHV